MRLRRGSISRCAKRLADLLERQCTRLREKRGSCYEAQGVNALGNPCTSSTIRALQHTWEEGSCEQPSQFATLRELHTMVPNIEPGICRFSSNHVSYCRPLRHVLPRDLLAMVAARAQVVVLGDEHMLKPERSQRL